MGIFPGWRARATKAVRWGSKRKYKNTPQPGTQISEKSSPAGHIYADLQDPAQPTNEVQGFPLGPEHTRATQHMLEDNITPEHRSNGFIRPTAYPESEIQKLREFQEDTIVAVNERLIEQQKDVSAKRLKVRESRMALRHKRDEVSGLRSGFMEQLDSFFAHLDHADEELLRGYEQLQDATEEHMRMEISYHQEEDQLEEEEYMLALSMESFAGLSGSGSSSNRPGRWTQHASPTKRSGIPRCIASYLKRIADERMLQESLSELESEWFLTLERQKDKHRSSDEDSEFLRTFNQQRIDIWKDLNNAQLDVDSLRIVCIEQGYTNFDYEDLSSLNLYRYDGEHIPEVHSDPLKLAPGEQFHYDSIIKTPDQDSGISLDLGSETLEVPLHGLGRNESHKSGEFVNKWMLHNLRISSMGIWHLQHLPIWDPLRRMGWDNYDISHHVLDGWFYDGTALAPLSTTSSYHSDGVTMIAKNE